MEYNPCIRAHREAHKDSSLETCADKDAVCSRPTRVISEDDIECVCKKGYFNENGKYYLLRRVRLERGPVLKAGLFWIPF